MTQTDPNVSPAGADHETLRARLRRFAKSPRGVAAVEFGFIAPVMLAIWLGTSELTIANAIDRKIALAANSMADLTARQVRVDDATLDGLFEAGRAILYPHAENLSAEDLELEIVSIEIDEDGEATVLWGETDDGTELAEGAAFPLETGLLDEDEAGCAVLGRVFMRQPVVFLSRMAKINNSEKSFGSHRELEHTFAYRPRGVLCVRRG
jgi:Flp pilus assembly pilin Flp